MVGSRSKPASRRAHSDAENFEVDDLSVSRQSGMTNSSSRMPDFFGAGIFQVVLHNPTTNHQLLLFSESRLCSENVEFLSKVEQYRVILNDLATTMATIHKEFISEDSPRQITAPAGSLKTVHSDMKKIVLTSLPAMESIFGETQERIEQMVFTDIYPRFVRHQMTLSAIRALANDRHRYQGLGDCFCLTNPNKADNPIVFASDGFVKVTGYARPEVIPRNCRFLQGTHTDRAVVRRLREGIDARRDVVELLLNYKKNGDPFWNLLYMAPLFDENGKLAFFIGGQVNCSTTIHSNADVMRILSLSNKEEPEEEVIPKINGTGSTRSKGISSARKAILKAFGVQFNDPTPGMIAETAGMERKVLGRMEGRDLSAQMKEFYTAYSKYIVIRYDTFVIHFYSQGVTDMLNPANTSGLVAGNDIFRFFRANMTVPQNDYKTRVRNALRMGQPLSVELRLQTSRSALFRGDESFMSHWTPLKDEKGAVAWVVVTLAPVML
ncbi:hypothetical protein GQ53DRAFT_668285 [Thozetella sp. PMI_491]|nr:hypothetical protein GQ53DRAFT_668285 [Thozetella sp. PMI_491]